MPTARSPAEMLPNSIAWALIAAAPAAMVWSTWHVVGPPPADVVFARFAAPPLLGIEAAVIGLALLRGFRPAATLRCLPGWTRLCLVLLLLIAGLTATRVPDASMAALRFGTTAIHLGFGLALGYLAGRDGVPPFAWRALAVGGLVYLVAVAVFVRAVPDWSAHDWRRMGLGVVNVRHAGFYAAVAAASAIGVASLAERWTSRIGWTLTAAVLASLLAWLGSRGGLIALAGGASITAATLGFRRHFATPLVALIALVAGSIASLALPVPGADYGIVRISTTVSGEVADPSSGRTALWRQTLSQVGERRLLGHGEGSFFGTPASHGEVHHPHQAALQLLHQWGIAGLLLTAMIGLWVWGRMRAGVRADDALLPGFLVANTLLVYALYDGIFFFVYPAMMLVAACAATAGAGVASAAPGRYLSSR